MKFSTHKYMQNLKGFDLFGHIVSMNYKENSAYNTYLSSFLSIISICLMVSNLVLLCIAFKNGEKQEEKTTFIQVDRFDSPSYYLGDNGVEIAIFQEWDES